MIKEQVFKYYASIFLAFLDFPLLFVIKCQQITDLPNLIIMEKKQVPTKRDKMKDLLIAWF